MIAQGSTPYLLLQIDGYDLTGAEVIVVTIKSQTVKMNFESDRVRAVTDGTNSILTVHLTQEESLSLYPTSASIQVRWRDADGEAYTTVIRNVDVASAIHKGVI